MPSLHLASVQDVITTAPGQHSALELAKAYAALGERPIPLCDPLHGFTSRNHRGGYIRSDGTTAPPCKHPGKAPLERDYPRFASASPSEADLHRMFSSHTGNIGDVVPEGRIVIDVDARSGGLESMDAYVQRFGPLPWTPSALTGGNGIHYHFELPLGTTVPSGGSLASLGYPGVEWKGPGAQVVLPPSVHPSGTPYRWEPGFAPGEVPLAPIPTALLELILDSSHDSSSRRRTEGPSTAIEHVVQLPEVQRYFIELWSNAGLDVKGMAGDQFYPCPFHDDRDPSLHLDSQRCIWYCFAPHCRAFGGGGIRQLEALVGPTGNGCPPMKVSLRPEDTAASPIGKEDSLPDGDAAGEIADDLRVRARQLFPLPKGEQPQVVVRLYAFQQDPSKAMRQQVISNTWVNPVNRALKRRVLWAHLVERIVYNPNDDTPSLYEICVPGEDWRDRKRESLTAQVRRRKGDYACFDNRRTSGEVRFLTSVPIPDALPVDDAAAVLYEALRDVDLPEDHHQKHRVHLVWLSKGWALPSHEPKGEVKLIAFKKNVEPVDDVHEAAQAQKLGLQSWLGKGHQLDQWGIPRYFAVPPERVAQVGLEGALDDLLAFAAVLGYQRVRDPWSKLFGTRTDAVETG